MHYEMMMNKKNAIFSFKKYYFLYAQLKIK